ncbi:MAG: hypothetical protein IGR92_04170 [Leptolyngbyaceae cyanobacterium T60_A2020_046]|nr:hypothetical protein [Leptolyngbyaceae cyanobacterium T60_A2020_046]
MKRQRLHHLAICRNLACLLLGWIVLLWGVAYVRHASSQPTDRYSPLEKLAIYGIILRATQE